MLKMTAKLPAAALRPSVGLMELFLSSWSRTRKNSTTGSAANVWRIEEVIFRRQSHIPIMTIFLVLFVMIIMNVIVLLTVTGTNNVAEMQLNFWREKLPSVQVPETIAASASPLTQEEVNAFVEIIKGGNLRFHATQFCNSANLLCFQSVSMRMGEPIYTHVNNNSELDEKSHAFFPINKLRERGQMKLPKDYSASFPPKAFLPRNLSQLIPFATVALSDVVSSFGILWTSNMTKEINKTLIACEGKPIKGEFKMCTTSIEGMIEFVLSNFGSPDNIELHSHPALTGDYGKKARVTKVVERSGPPLVCHRLVYPYGMFYCHSVNGTLTFTMELEVLEKNGNMDNATAVCHPDLQSKGSFFCHLILGHTLLWLAKDKR